MIPVNNSYRQGSKYKEMQKICCKTGLFINWWKNWLKMLRSKAIFVIMDVHHFQPKEQDRVGRESI